MTVKTIGNAIKNPVGMFRRNKSIIKNIACGLQKNYLRTRYNFGRKSVKYLGEEGIKKFKYMTPWAATRGKQLVGTRSNKNIYMRSIAQMGKKKIRYLAKKSAEQMRGKELSSLINMVSQSKPQLPLLFVTGGLNRLTQFNLRFNSGPDIDNMKKAVKKVDQNKKQRQKNLLKNKSRKKKSKKKDNKDIEKVDEHKEQSKEDSKNEPKEQSKEDSKKEPKEQSKEYSKNEPKEQSKGDSKKEPKEQSKGDSKKEPKEEKPKVNYKKFFLLAGGATVGYVAAEGIAYAFKDKQPQGIEYKTPKNWKGKMYDYFIK